MTKLILKYHELGRIGIFVKLTFLMFFLFAFHVIIIYYIKNIFGFDINSIQYIMIKMWKEMLLFAMIILYLMGFSLSIGNNTSKIVVIDWVIIGYLIMGIVYLVFSPNLLVGLWSFRSLFEIFGFYFLGRLCSYHFKDFKIFFTVLTLAGVITSIFSVIQVEYLGVDFFYEVYGVDDIAIALTGFDYGKIRASSTFITPHEFGLFLTMALIGLYYLISTNDKYRRLYFFFALIIVTGLIYSLSRSSYLILSVLIVVISIRNRNFIIYGVIFFLLAYSLMDALGILANISSIFSGEDTSSSGRMDVLSEAISYYQKYPFGSGLGSVGVVVRRFNPEAPQFEGEIFNILAMIGPLGLLIHLGLYGLVIYRAQNTIGLPGKSIRLSRLSMVVVLFVITMFLRELILPRDFTNYTIGWFIIGGFISLTNSLEIKVNFQDE